MSWIESRTDRQRREVDLDASDRLLPAPVAKGNRTILVQTVEIDTYPTSSNNTFGVVQVRSLGQESEGYPPYFVVLTSPFTAQILGSNVPTVGTYLLVTATEGRWVGTY